MKQIFYYIAMLFTTIVLCTNLASCSKDDDDNGNSSNSQTENRTDEDKTHGEIQGHEWVDLGLPSGIKWATCNVGSSKPEGFGLYYGWGDPTGKKISSNTNDFPNSNPPSDIKETKYDIAYNNWGKNWRMPTDKEFKELFGKCYYYNDIVNGVKGVTFRGSNGNTIFLPIAGYHDYSTLRDTDAGRYWTSTISSEWKHDANCFYITNNGSDGAYANLTTSLRCNRLSVRAVSDASSDMSGGNNSDNDDGDDSDSGGNTTYEKPDIAFYDFTAYQTKLKVVYKIYNKDEAKVTSAKIYYGTSSASKSVSATVSGTLITATISGLKAGTTYYVKCSATGKGGTTTTETTKLITNY